MKQWATGRAEEVRTEAGRLDRPGEVIRHQERRLQDFNNFMKIVVDAGAADARTTGIPSGVYNFATVFNNTRFDFSLSRGLVFNPLEIIGNCPAYTLLTFPFNRETSDLFIRWEGPIGTGERCMIFLTETNMGLVGQFRPPAVAAAQTIQVVRENFGVRLFAGVLSEATLFTAARATDIQSFYLTNTLATVATVTIVHRRPGVADVHLVSGLSIAANMTFSLGYIAMLTGDSIVVTAVTGTIHGSLYGVM